MTAPDPGDWIYVGSVAVDSGRLLVIDPAYERPTATGLDLALRSSNVQASELALSEHPLHSAIACRTGDGDGVYPCFVRLAPGLFGDLRVAELRVQFLFDDE